MGLPSTKRHLIELLHKNKLTYEQVARYSGIDVERIKAIKKGQEATDEEKIKLKTSSMVSIRPSLKGYRRNNGLVFFIFNIKFLYYTNIPATSSFVSFIIILL